MSQSYTTLGGTNTIKAGKAKFVRSGGSVRENTLPNDNYSQN